MTGSGLVLCWGNTGVPLKVLEHGDPNVFCSRGLDPPCLSLRDTLHTDHHCPRTCRSLFQLFCFQFVTHRVLPGWSRVEWPSLGPAAVSGDGSTVQDLFQPLLAGRGGHYREGVVAGFLSGQSQERCF